MNQLTAFCVFPVDYFPENGKVSPPKKMRILAGKGFHGLAL
jgi:hypothetical protein